MTRRYLFGPVTAEFAEQKLKKQRASGDCLAFNHEGNTDLTIKANDTWEDICSRFPDGWQPDFVVLHLPYTHIPTCLWSAPLPLIGLAGDWNLLWHYYRRRLRQCDLVLTDTRGVETLAKEGIRHARPANLFGLDRVYTETAWPEAQRDIDVLFIGNMQPAVQRERLPWLGRLARLSDRWKVEIGVGVFGALYREMLGRARIVFNRSIRGECNQRVFEAAAAGAILFQETGNRETPAYFQDRKECVYYTPDNLEALLEHYLEHEDERRTIAEAARAKVGEFAFEKLWNQHLEVIESDWATLTERAGHRPIPEKKDELLTRTWQMLGCSRGEDETLFRDLRAAVEEHPDDSALSNAWGLVFTLINRRGEPMLAHLSERAAGHFRQAWESDPADVMAGLNLIEALTGIEQKESAIELARKVLARIEGELPAPVLDAGHFPPTFDHFRVEWEQAAWANAGNPTAEAQAKRDLLRWRLHSLLAEWTEDLSHYAGAVEARPDLPTSQALLGCALGQAKRFAEAAAHLHRAASANPFDCEAARLLFRALKDGGDEENIRRLARERRRMNRVAPRLVPSEEWFEKAPPVGDELASIIVLCCNELDYTRLCLESVLQQTRMPYELILVDNGSTDGTPAYLDKFARQPGQLGPERVVIVRNESNRGYPAGCNQGLAQARGRYVVFLNNDTIVNPGWLDRLIAWSLHDWPKVGMVGPVTNSAAPPQQVEVDYADRSGLEAFAARLRRAAAGKAMRAPRLTGFCMLVRREVLDQVGGFDEDYGPGVFEDDDLCVRAREAGFECLIAQDVFVHHFGGRTFAGLGIDWQKQVQDNFARFKEKWPKQATAYQLPETPPPSPSPESMEADAEPTAIVTSAKKGTVSLCLIVKNEEDNLPACLESASELADEIVVVDTGSTDKTKEVAERFGAKVYDFPWIDSFAAARNDSLKHATGEWIFWLDADDRLDENNRRKLKELFATLKDENVAYVMKCVCLPEGQIGSATVVDHVRLFRNHPRMRWEYRVHEQILPSLRRMGGDVRWSDVVIQHVGYQDPSLRRRKLDRDLRLLNLENAEKPDDPFVLFNLGSVYQELGQIAEAVPLLCRSLELSHPSDSIVRKLYALLSQCHRHLGQKELALAACRKGREFYPDDVELLFQEGILRRELGDVQGAEACLLKLLEPKKAEHFASVDAGLAGPKARHNLASLYHEQGRLAEAESQWRLALAGHPSFVPAWLGLGEIQLAQNRWDDLEQTGRQLAEFGLATEADVLRARGRLARKEFPAAKQILEETIARYPQALGPRRILSYVFLQEGKDPVAAEKALRDLLALAPDDAEAKHNLEVLLRQEGRA